MTIQSTGSPQAKIAIVGEFPSEQDILRNEPFCGTSGLELSKMLNEAGTARESCFLSLVCNDRVSRGRVDGLVALKKKLITPQHVQWNGKFVLPQLIEGVERLKRELETLKPNVVCAMGNLAMWVLTGQWGVTDWRSSIMESTLIPGLKVIPTISPNVLYGQWSQRVLIVHDLRRVVKESTTPRITRAHYSHVIRPSFERARDTLRGLIDEAKERIAHGQPRLELGGDIETRAGHIACIAFAWSATAAICIPFMCQHNDEGYWPADQEAELVHLIYQLCQLCTIDGQNWNYDAQYIFRHWHFTVPEGQVYDTMIAHHSCFSNFPKNLSFLSSMYLDDHLHWKDDRTNWVEGPKGEGEDKYWIYNCTDSCRTYAIAQVLRGTVKALGMEAVNEFQQGMAAPVLRTMIRGVRLDKVRREQFSFTLLDEAEKRRHWMREVLGEEVNIKSPKQMAELFYEVLGQRVIRKRNDEGVLVPTTNDEALRKIAEREPLLKPLTRKIAELRSLGVFHSTFVQAALDIDGRIRTSFNICGTETYRFASSKNAFGTGLNCFPPGAEALTETGWVKLENLQEGQRIAAYNPSAGRLKWEQASPISQGFSGLLYSAISEQYSTTVTANHRILSTKAGRQQWKVHSAEVLAQMADRLIPISGDLEGGFSFSAERLLVAALADGHYESDRVRFNLAKQRKCDRLEQLCLRYGIELHETKPNEKAQQRRFWFHKPADWPEAKKWGWWVLQLTSDSKRAMLEECRYWDGHDRGGSFKFFTADSEQAEVVHTLAHLCEYGATKYTQEQGERSWSDTLMHVVNVKPRGCVQVSSKHWTSRPYSGPVYCVTVPSSFFLVRQDGFVSITGNCQNIPSGGETEDDGLELPNVRTLFIPDEGMEYFDIDLDSADLRIVTWESGCEWMKDHFRNKRKPYVEVMKEYYRNPSMTKNSHPREYAMFKALCHGTNYLGTAEGIAPRIGLIVHETERIQKWYYGMCPEIKRWQDEIKKQVTKRRYIQNVFGYRTYFFDKIEGTIFNQAVAWIPQSSVGCLINRGYKKIDTEHKHIEILLQVHDSLAGQFPIARSEECKRQVIEASQVVLPYEDPLVIPVGIKTSTKSWGECG